MLAIYLVSAIINLLLFGGFMFRYKQTGVKPYLWIGLAVLANVVSSAVLAFLGDMLFDSFIVSLAIIYAASIISSIAGLVVVMVILHLIRVWIASMRSGTAPEARKLDLSDRVCGYLRIVYPVLTFAAIVFYVLLVVSLGFAAVLALVVGLAFCFAVVALDVILIWMYLDVHRQGSRNESELRKRNQLLKLAGMAFFSAWPAMLAGVGAGIGGIFSSWVFYVIALWPGALCNIDEPVQSAGAAGMPGGAPVHNMTAAPAYPGGDYKYPASQPAYHPDVPNAGQWSQPPSQGQYQQPPPQPPHPQAAYQPAQQYGGQPQQPYYR